MTLARALHRVSRDTTKGRSVKRKTQVMKTTRIEWQEQRRGDCGGWELFDVVAEKDAAERTGWAFYEKTSWDVTWIRIPVTLCRLAKALIEEEREGSRLRLATFHMPISRGVRQDSERVCSLNGKRFRARGSGRSRVTAYVPPAHMDRRMGHTSRVHRALRIAKGLLELQGMEREPVTSIEARESALATGEDDAQPPPHGRRDFAPAASYRSGVNLGPT